jgi:hypothetical protein
MTTLDQTTRDQIKEELMKQEFERIKIKNSIEKQKKPSLVGKMIPKLPFHFKHIKESRLRKKVESK